VVKVKNKEQNQDLLTDLLDCVSCKEEVRLQKTEVRKIWVKNFGSICLQKIYEETVGVNDCKNPYS